MKCKQSSIWLAVRVGSNCVAFRSYKSTQEIGNVNVSSRQLELGPILLFITKINVCRGDADAPLPFSNLCKDSLFDVSKNLRLHLFASSRQHSVTCFANGAEMKWEI